MGSIVYAKEAAGVFTEGGPVNVARGQAWDSDSDVVKANPSLFEDEPTKVEGRRIERATRAPGERSNARDPRKADADAKKAAAAAKRKATMAAKKAAAAAAKKADEAAKSDGAE